MLDSSTGKAFFQKWLNIACATLTFRHVSEEFNKYWNTWKETNVIYVTPICYAADTVRLFHLEFQVCSTTALFLINLQALSYSNDIVIDHSNYELELKHYETALHTTTRGL